MANNNNNRNVANNATRPPLARIAARSTLVEATKDYELTLTSVTREQEGSVVSLAVLSKSSHRYLFDSVPVWCALPSYDETDPAEPEFFQYDDDVAVTFVSALRMLTSSHLRKADFRTSTVYKNSPFRAVEGILTPIACHWLTNQTLALNAAQEGTDVAIGADNEKSSFLYRKFLVPLRSVIKSFLGIELDEIEDIIYQGLVMCIVGDSLLMGKIPMINKHFISMMKSYSDVSSLKFNTTREGKICVTLAGHASGYPLSPSFVLPMVRSARLETGEVDTEVVLEI